MVPGISEPRPSKRMSASALSELDTSTPPPQVRRRLSCDDDFPAPAERDDAFHAILASTGCFLNRSSPPGGPPVLSFGGDTRNVVQNLERRLKLDASVLALFLQSFHSFIADEANLRRILLPMTGTGKNGAPRSCDSLARVLLSVGQIQSTVAASLLERIPEYVSEVDNDIYVPLPSLMDSFPRLILSQFRWLEFLVDSRALTEKLLEVLSICPVCLKKEIITSLPEVIVDADHEMVVQSLETMLQDDLQLIVPILDAFSNLNLEEGLFQQVVSLALSSLRSADVEDLPLVVKFLLQSATVANVRQVVQQLRENLHFVTIADVRATMPDRKMKGKSAATNCEALVLEAIRSGLRFQNLVRDASLKEIRGVEGERNHKVVDIWLLLIVHANGGPHRRTAEQLLLKKIIRGDIGESLLRQCIQGRGESLQDYFPTLISISEASLRSREPPARQFGRKSYVLLFQEFVDPYYRQEVLGALISHTGSGNSHEIGSALETLLLFATNYAHDLLPVSSFINGVLDYLEGFQLNHLHQVYQIFSHLAVFAWSSGGVSSGSSIGSELLIIVRKQITNSESKYRRMGIIGAVGLATCLSKRIDDNQDANPQEPNTEETLSLLQMTLEACKSSSLYRGFFYDELTSQIETTPVQPCLLDWISKHTSEFEGLFLGDLDGGELQTAHDFGILEGELWMNLDADMSPIVVNVLTLLMNEDQRISQALMYLPANFRLLAAAETIVNEDGLGGIDALLGCPILLPKHQLIIGEQWDQLSRHQKELGCLALLYTINWFRELINAFSTQVDREVSANFTQSTKADTVAKLFKRVRNLMFVEHCLAKCLESTKIEFPRLHFIVDGPSQPRSESKPQGPGQDGNKSLAGKRGRKRSLKRKKGSEENSQGLPTSGQRTIDALNKSNGTGGAETSTPERQAGQSTSTQATEKREPAGGGLDEQRWKFRPLTLSSLNLLAASETFVEACCSDPHAQLPLFLYILQDLHLKLDGCLDSSSRKLVPSMNVPASPKAPSGLGEMSGIDVLRKLIPLYPSLRKLLDCSISVLRTDISQSRQIGENRNCDLHWVKESLAAGNYDDETFYSSTIEAAKAVVLVTTRCFGKILSYPELIMPANIPLLKTILLAFGHGERLGSNLVPLPTPGSLEEALCHTYDYLDSLSEAAPASSFTISTELVMVLKALVKCSQACSDKSKDDTRTNRSVEILPHLCSRLSLSAERVLRQDWNADDWKNKGDILQQLLRMQIQNSDTPAKLLEELICSVMRQVPSKGAAHGSVTGYPALSSGTFLIWYRVEHEEVLSFWSKVIKDFLTHSKSKAPVTHDVVAKLLASALQCITLHVSLVNLTKSHDKTPIHALAVKSGGKFLDIFLRGMDFLKSHYHAHKDAINALVKELQKATRIIQTLCADAKGKKRMPVTCKVPVVKRSMERYVYCVKALLHCTSHGSSFWMGTLKHKDLQGREISSQAYAADADEEQFDNQDSENEEEEPNNSDGEMQD